MNTRGDTRITEFQLLERRNWSRRSGLNRRPVDYESTALPLCYAGILEGSQSCDDKKFGWELQPHPNPVTGIPLSVFLVQTFVPGSHLLLQNSDLVPKRVVSVHFNLQQVNAGRKIQQNRGFSVKHTVHIDLSSGGSR